MTTKEKRKRLINALWVIENSKELTENFYHSYGEEISLEVAKNAIHHDILKESIEDLILRMVASVYLIDNRLFVRGDETEVTITHDNRIIELVEIFDISSQIETGEVYSFLCTTTEHFQFAGYEETLEVMNFLKKMNDVQD